MTWRYERRDVAQAVGVKPPDQRQHELAGRRDGKACDERVALRRREAREQTKHQRPDGYADQRLAEQVGANVHRESQRQRQRNGKHLHWSQLDRAGHRQSAACGSLMRRNAWNANIALPHLVRHDPA